MDGKREYYDFNCLALLTKEQMKMHMSKGCDVDQTPQSHYEEIEKAAGLQS